MRTDRRLIVDARLTKPDPARKPLEEPIAFRHLPKRVCGARRQEPEVAGVFRNFVARPPIQQGIKRMNAGSPQPGFILAMSLCRIDHVVTIIEPTRHQRVDQIGRMLSVAVHEQHCARRGVIEPRQERGFLAEISRQRNNLDVERNRGERSGDVASVVAAAIVDIHDFDIEPASGLLIARDLGDTFMQGRQPFSLVEQRHDDRQRRRQRRCSRARARFGRFSGHPW
jgi:hypothetical protein